MADINERLTNVQSWWIGSELVRRHPELTLIETHPGGGQYDCLTLVRSQPDPVENLVWLNRAGSIRVGDHMQFLTWEAERDYGDRHGAVRRIEAAAGLDSVKATPPSTAAAVALRAICRVLTSMLNEPEPWDARSAFYDSSGGDSGFRDLSAFPSAARAMEEHRPNDLDGHPGYRFWLLRRGDSTVAVVDTDAVVHLPDRHASLSDAYLKSKRSMTLAISATLGDVLP
ncbi:hypothetical protein BJ986_002266 [Phycicoccus badiiscoriae]|uniref:T3SS peptide-binding chaperone domain-containing protein n=1 Tax=Pedococcus badiiscoriae TaxID=642776 RepID=A0A852WG87_9MICO|nr:hypothetical protein [Pedococcus badiiscoriae]NYG07779.1 hypothetical protein [Pedococcus badiiscoriae]